ncbi:hypothetical protein [Maridesulfovibrio frigidus]|uniref:hypothetical protein n=1 Tax=Maridesulfovibrio frigidus TaxID=340956 RepID=UPI000A7ADA97|nr:hypothetical protein [Maridesulfovibrio frigidus]
MLHGETVQSPLPMDLPWWQPDHVIFFGVLYAVIAVLGAGLVYCAFKAWMDSKDQATEY